ncbi:MAG: DUF4422 domain-containing protein [Gemmiger sp.]
MGRRITIIVATHKAYLMPDMPMYLPVQVGSAISKPLPYTRDDSGYNISEKNPTFCELTGLYWGWKNLDAAYLGLCHYRRYFSRRRTGSRWARILTEAEARRLLQTTDVILPKKRHYWIETNYTQYIHAHHQRDLNTTRQILSERYPGYLAAYDAVMARTSGHRFNMFIMKKELLDAYCGWLFDVLFELERRLDISGYDAVSRRVFGYVGERLLDVWVETNHIEYQELPVVNMESQNWPKKISQFLLRKWNGTRKETRRRLRPAAEKP